MNRTLVPLAVLLLFAGCTQEVAPEERGATTSPSTANRVDCDIRRDAVVADHMAGIVIEEPTAVSITQKEKIRHLNELNATSDVFLGALRARQLPIKLTGGGVTTFPELAHLRGQVPRGWEGTGYTWDDVPGTGYTAGVFLGDSAMPNNAWSLAIHEATHAIDLTLDLSAKSVALSKIYRAELARPVVAADSVSSYRRSNVQEFLAVAADEYFCSRMTRERLQTQYPDAYAFMRDRFDEEIRIALGQE